MAADRPECIPVPAQDVARASGDAPDHAATHRAEPMPWPSPLLAMDASTSAGSLALFVRGRVVGSQDVTLGAGPGDPLFAAVASLLAAHDVPAGTLAGVACGAGPGGFTSLRLAAALAKGLLQASGGRLFAIPSLVLAAAGAGLARGEVVAVHADALRGERFVQLVEGLGDGLVRGVGPVRRLSLDELEALGTGDSAVASGRAVERLAVAASPTPVAERAVCTPQAADLRRVAGWLAAGPVPLATWEPDYGRLAEAQVQWEQRHGRPLDRPA